ncbi:hypothetical protein ACFX15_013869 [Malus domestica]
MTHLQKLRLASVRKWVSLNCCENRVTSSPIPFQPIGYFCNALTFRMYSTNGASANENSESSDKTSTSL